MSFIRKLIYKDHGEEMNPLRKLFHKNHVWIYVFPRTYPMKSAVFRKKEYRFGITLGPKVCRYCGEISK
jgi:hypothetical protein